MVDQSYPETAQLPLSPEMVLTAAREVVMHLHSLNKPYSADVMADCILTIENLLARAPAQGAGDCGEKVVAAVATKCAEIADRHSYAAAQAILQMFAPTGPSVPAPPWRPSHDRR